MDNTEYKVKLESGSIGHVYGFCLIGSMVRAVLSPASVDMSKPANKRFTPAIFENGVVSEFIS